LLADTKDWYDDAIGTIHARDIQACLDLIRGGDDDYKPRPYLANLLHARMKAFFAWCAKPNIGKIAVSPMLGIDKPFADTKRRERPWFKEQAADAAIKSIWFAADTIGGVEGKYLKTLLLTGKRRTALAEMRWEQIKLASTSVPQSSSLPTSHSANVAEWQLLQHGVRCLSVAALARPV
jgi:integrase